MKPNECVAHAWVVKFFSENPSVSRILNVVSITAEEAITLARQCLEPDEHDYQVLSVVPALNIHAVQKVCWS